MAKVGQMVECLRRRSDTVGGSRSQSSKSETGERSATTLDVEKQVAYWQNGAREELETAELLLKNNKVNQGLFWSHLALEKALKALVARHTRALPPFIHDLVRLADQAAIPLDDEQRAFLAACNRFAVHGRYEMPQAPIVASHEVAATWDRVQEMVQWLLTL